MLTPWYLLAPWMIEPHAVNCRLLQGELANDDTQRRAPDHLPATIKTLVESKRSAIQAIEVVKTHSQVCHGHCDPVMQDHTVIFMCDNTPVSLCHCVTHSNGHCLALQHCHGPNVPHAV